MQNQKVKIWKHFTIKLFDKGKIYKYSKQNFVRVFKTRDGYLRNKEIKIFIIVIPRQNQICPKLWQEVLLY